MSAALADITPLAWALRHAARGWHVLPLIEKSKLPMTREWQRRATVEPLAIASIWGGNPRAGVGIYCTGGLLVLDVDCKVDAKGDRAQGFESLAELEERHGPLPRTCTVRTPSGGSHFYFTVESPPSWLTNSVSKLGPGLDVRAGGKGYVAAPGTTLAEGAYELVDDVDPAPCPQWLLDALEPKEAAAPAALPAPSTATSPAPDRYAARAFESALAAITVAVEGTRNDVLNREAHGLFRLVGAGRLKDTEVDAAIRRAAQGSGLEAAEIEATIKSARKGLESPNHEGLPAQATVNVSALLKAGRAANDPRSVEGPEPLRRSTGQASPFPFDALGAVLGPAVAAVNEYVQAPLALCAQSALSVASLVAQRLYNVGIHGREHPLSLWLLTVAESGERKSAADAVLCREVKEWERVQYAAYKIERDAYLREADAFAKQEAKAVKAGLSAAEPPTPPLEATVITGEPTLEGLHKLLLKNRGWAGLLSDEGGQFIGGHAMSRDNMGKTMAGLSGLWDSGTADRVRGGDGVAKLYGKRVALHLMMQPVFAEELLSNPKASGQGFLARCLIAWPASTAGHRPYRAADVQADPRMQAFHARLSALLTVPEPMREGERNELEPRRLPLDDEATAYWIRAHDAIEVRQRPGGEYETIKAWASKAPEQVLRIAGVLTVLDRDHPEAIRLAEVKAAAALVDWYLAEALRLRGVASVPQEIRDAEAVLAWCRERGLESVHSADLVRLGPAAIRTADAVHAAMTVLERHGWAQRIEGGAVLDGKHRRHAWTITPEPEA